MSKKNIVYALLLGAAGLLSLLLLTLSWVYPPQPLRRSPSFVLTDSEGKWLYAELSPEGEWNIPISLDQMGHWLKLLAVNVEDKRFYSHIGVDPLAIARALKQNIAGGKRVSGASTISSQTVRLRGYSRRGYGMKIIEFARAIKLDWQYSKDDILELYLNNTPYGGNLWGVEAAAHAYFGKRAEALSLGESALLISLLRSPSRLRPDKYPHRARKSRDFLLKNLYDRHVIASDDLQRALLEPIPTRRHAFPKEGLLLGKTTLILNRQGLVKTTLHSTYQDKLQSALIAKLDTLPKRVSGAGILVDNKTGDVLAYVANARFGTSAPHAWVNALMAPRSPGSTLKPFVYAEAFDRGLLTPQSLLADTPLTFGGKAPRNFDLRYRGPLSARKALAESINVPAVRVLRLLGLPQTLNLFRRLGFERLTQSPEFYGDSLVLGGCEVTAWELATAYRVLANGGRKSPLSLVKEERGVEGEPLFSQGSSFLTLDILKDEQRMIPLYREVFRGKARDIAFKTGTSYGLRDAWTVASSPQHTLVIWIGDPTGEAHPALSGLQNAAPVAINVLHSIYSPSEGRFKRPADVGDRHVCALSGAPLGEYCDESVLDYYIKHVSPTESCTLHVAGATGANVVWPEALASWGERAIGDRLFLPEEKPRILSPKADARLIALNGDAVRLLLESEGGEGVLYWFIDSTLVATGERGQRHFVDVALGKHTLSLSDERGNSSSISFEVIDRSRTRPSHAIPVLN